MKSADVARELISNKARKQGAKKIVFDHLQLLSVLYVIHTNH